MASDKYSLNTLSLRFRDEATESLYRDYIMERTLTFCRIAWGLVIFIGALFGMLDRPIFEDKSGTATMIRMILLVLASLAMATTFSTRLRRFLELSSSLLVFLVGIFCISLITIGDRSTFSPHFAGLFFAFTGMLSTAGLGFRYSFCSLLAILIIFEIAVGIVAPVSYSLFVVYNFFLPAIILIFAYIGYLVERVSRENFIVSAKLRDSLSEVRTLSGLLPICAHCKRIRDDKGYWNQIDAYIRDHSEATLSHGICPSCVKEFYSDLDIETPKEQD